jgi:hypothetical protein
MGVTWIINGTRTPLALSRPENEKSETIKISQKELLMQNEIYRHRKSRPPIVYGRDGFTTGVTVKVNGHSVGCCGDYRRNCVAGCSGQ